MVPASIRGFILFVPFCPVLVPWDIRGTSAGQVKAYGGYSFECNGFDVF